MMLVHSLPTSIDDHGKQESSCVWLSGDDSWQEPKNSVSITLTKLNSKDNTLWSHNLLSSSEVSTEVNASETPLNYVYKRRMNVRNVLPLNPSSIPTLVYKRRKVQCDDSKSGSVDGEFIGDPKSKTKKCSGLHINDSCSSTKSTVLKQVDDVGECSSSSVVIMEGTNSCFSFSEQHGMIERRISTRKPTGGRCLKACKVCDRLTKSLKMLICDLCEESFHMSCCNPAIKKVPVGDWFCNSCSRKKLKKMETNSSKLPESCLGPVASMLRDSDPFTSNVRIGEDFQAEIPDCSGPLTDEPNGYLEPMEVRPLERAGYQDWDVRKLSRLSSIGNWLQCREVVDGVDGSVCGKWRRAPLFEVQSDDWECFSSVLWDPTHADCAVPQELDTDQVLKQLKYIEMLRPRLSAKRWKLGINKRVEDPINTQKS